MTEAQRTSTRGKFKHCRYYFNGRLLSAFEIADELGRSKKYVQKILLNEKVKHDQDVTHLLRFQGAKRKVLDAEVIPTNPDGPGRMLRAPLERRILLQRQWIKGSLARAEQALRSSSDLSESVVGDALSAYKNLMPLVFELPPKLRVIREIGAFVALCIRYPYFTEIACNAIQLARVNGRVLTSEMMEIMVARYGSNSRIKDSMRHTLETLAELRVLYKHYLSRRNSAWYFTRSKHFRSHSIEQAMVSELKQGGVASEQIEVLLKPWPRVDDTGPKVSIEIDAGLVDKLKYLSMKRGIPFEDLLAEPLKRV